MKVISPIQEYQNFSFDAEITPRSPNSGFSLYFGNTGVSGFTTGIGFYGISGLVFDCSGDFFGGYYSGRQIKIEGHLFNDRLSYLYDGTLVKNNLASENVFNSIEFNKLGESELIINFDYIRKVDDGYVYVYAENQIVELDTEELIQVPEEYANA